MSDRPQAYRIAWKGDDGHIVAEPVDPHTKTDLVLIPRQDWVTARSDRAFLEAINERARDIEQLGTFAPHPEPAGTVMLLKLYRTDALVISEHSFNTRVGIRLGNINHLLQTVNTILIEPAP